jgi:hypothetical protein
VEVCHEKSHQLFQNFLLIIKISYFFLILLEKIPIGAALNSDHFEIDESITQNRAEVIKFFLPTSNLRWWV